MRHYEDFTVSSFAFRTSTKCSAVFLRQNFFKFLTRYTELAQCAQLPTLSPMLHTLRIQPILSFPLPLELCTSKKRSYSNTVFIKELV